MPSSGANIDPTTLSVQDINASELVEHSGMEGGYIGLSGQYYEFARQIGARTVVIPDYGTYFIYWLPEKWSDLEKKRVMMLLHGHDGTAAPRLYDVYENAKRYGFGMVSIQWGWRPRMEEDYRYLDETVEGMGVGYHIMELALEYIEHRHNVDKHLSAWNGFSRGSGSSIAYAYLDRKSGNNYFQLFMGIAGGLNLGSPLVSGLVKGEYGESPVTGKRFYLWCGTADMVAQERLIEGLPDTVCGRQELSAAALEDRGGVIEGFTATPEGDHMTWNRQAELQVEAIQLWLSERVRRVMARPIPRWNRHVLHVHFARGYA